MAKSIQELDREWCKRYARYEACLQEIYRLAKLSQEITGEPIVSDWDSVDAGRVVDAEKRSEENKRE